jgi:hypothetical protein
MKTVDLETSVSDFLALGRRLLSFQLLTGEHVLGELIAWYKDSRIIGASLDENADMILLQWGEIRPVDLTEPTDLRAVSDGKIQFLESKYQYLDFTRQVFANNEEKNLEFDDVAVQMSIRLCYESSTGSEPNSNLWIDMPDKIERAVEKFRATPFVGMLLDMPVRRAYIMVDHCG